jgi:hypothetical protein
LTAELPTLAACIQHAADCANEHEAIHLAATLQLFLLFNIYTEHALHIDQTALAAAVTIGDHWAQANALTNLGVVHLWGSKSQSSALTSSFTRHVRIR